MRALSCWHSLWAYRDARDAGNWEATWVLCDGVRVKMEKRRAEKACKAEAAEAEETDALAGDSKGAGDKDEKEKKEKKEKKKGKKGKKEKEEKDSPVDQAPLAAGRADDDSEGAAQPKAEGEDWSAGTVVEEQVTTASTGKIMV
jgi:hypothetical protein